MQGEDHAAGPGTSPPTIPDHEMLCVIGRGAYGEVWLARNAIGTLRAVKIVHRQSFQRVEHFEREFKGLLKFEPISRSHDGLVDVLQIGRRDDAGYFYYVMELADAARPPNENGELRMEDSNIGQPLPDHPPSSILDPQNYAPRTLRSELHSSGRLPPAECVNLGLKLASALEHLHANSLVHRDIKPSNIIFVNGEPKLADIGLVTAIDEALSLVGTAGYIPPEGPGTAQADIYSLGKVLYEIALGKDRQEFPQLPPDLPSHPDYAALLELNEVILKACESDPRQRYASATALGEDLALLQRGQSVKRQRLGQRRWAVAKKLGFAAVVVALLIGAVTFLKESSHQRTPSSEVAHLYELGRWHYSQLTEEDHEQALKYLSQAVQMDPKFVQPYGELAALYTWCMLPDITNDLVRLQKTQEIADKAMAIDPMSAEAHTALSWCRFLKRDWRGAENEIVFAIKLNPNLPIARDIYSFYLTMLGRTDEARREAQRAGELEPSASQRATAIIGTWPFIADRRFDLAIAQLQRVLELDRNFAWGHLYLGECYEVQSNYVATLDEYRAFDLLSGQDPAKIDPGYAAVRQAYESHGEVGYWQKRIELTLARESLPEAQRIDSEIVNEPLAGYYAKLGEKQKALDELEKHFDEPNVWHQIKFEPLYDSLHDEPRFKALVKRAGLEP